MPATACNCRAASPGPSPRPLPTAAEVHSSSGGRQEQKRRSDLQCHHLPTAVALWSVSTESTQPFLPDALHPSADEDEEADSEWSECE